MGKMEIIKVKGFDIPGYMGFRDYKELEEEAINRMGYIYHVRRTGSGEYEIDEEPLDWYDTPMDELCLIPILSELYDYMISEIDWEKIDLGQKRLEFEDECFYTARLEYPTIDRKTWLNGIDPTEALLSGDMQLAVEALTYRWKVILGNKYKTN